MNPVEIAALGALGAFGGEPIDVILGGYHLAGEGMEPRIAPTVHDLTNRVRPRVIRAGARTELTWTYNGQTAEIKMLGRFRIAGADR